MQLYKILSANNNLSTTERPYAATRNYYEKLKTQQELIQKHYQENGVQNWAILGSIGALFHSCNSKRLKNILNICT